MSVGYLEIVFGPMFSGKTTELIKEYNRHKACDIRCCFVNHSADDRYGSGTSTTKTHNQTSVNNDKSCKKLTDILWEAANYDAFFINEGQFFDDLYEVSLMVLGFFVIVVLSSSSSSSESSLIVKSKG